MDLAERAGVTQSVISAYKSGQRPPSLPALARLIDATGFELMPGWRRQPGRLLRLSGPVGRRVRRHRKDPVADFPPELSLFGLGVDEDLPDLERSVQALTRSVDQARPPPRHNVTEHPGSPGDSPA